MNMITTMFTAYNLFFPAGIRINCTIFLAVQLISLVACSFKCGIDGWFVLEPGSKYYTVECQCPGNQSNVASFRSLTISRSTAYAANKRLATMRAIGPEVEFGAEGQFIDTEPEKMIFLRKRIFVTALDENSGNYTCTAEGDNFEINYTISLQFTDICPSQVSRTPSSRPYSVTTINTSVNTSSFSNTITSASTPCVTSREAFILIVTIIPTVCFIIIIIFICIAVATSRRTTSQQDSDGTQAASSELGFPSMPSEFSQNLIMHAQGIDEAVSIDNQPGQN